MKHINLKFFSTISILLFCCIGQIFAQSSLAFNLPSSSYSQSRYWQGTDWRAERAFNRSSWNAGNYNTQWIQVDLGKSNDIHKITFSTGQSPSGVTWHEVYISDYPIEHSWNNVAHSMGGITTRFLIHKMIESPGQFGNIPSARNVVMLSTPNSGSYLANPSALEGFDFWRWSWVSTRSLTTGSMRTLRLRWPNNVSLYMAAGTTAGLSPDLRIGSTFITTLSSAPPEDQDNDGAVTVRSSFGNYLEHHWVGTVLSLARQDNRLFYVEKAAFPEGGFASQEKFFLKSLRDQIQRPCAELGCRVS